MGSVPLQSSFKLKICHRYIVHSLTSKPVPDGSEPCRIRILIIDTVFRGNKSFTRNSRLKQYEVLLFEFPYKKATEWREVILIWKSWAWKPEHHVLCRTWLQSSTKHRYSSKHSNYVFDSGKAGCLESTGLHCPLDHAPSTIYYNKSQLHNSHFTHEYIN
jgi:hypothetical protein